MPAPLLIQYAESPYTTLSPRTPTSIDGFEGDVVVAFSIMENYDTGDYVTLSNDDVALTWTLEQEVAVFLYTYIAVWTTVLPEDRPGLDVIFTRQGTSGFAYMGGYALFRSSDGVGATAQNHVSNGGPSCNITTTGDLSTIFIATADYDVIDGGSRVWRTTAGALVELSYVLSDPSITFYVGYHPDTGVAAAQNVGLSQPSNQKYSIIAVEVLAGTPRDVVPGELIHMKAR